jgi:ABC-type dipeptide/oligopeptide/nickel transport system permease subunit
VSAGSEMLQQEESDYAVGGGGPDESSEIAARSPLELFWRRLRDDKIAMIALGFIILLILVAIFAPLVTHIAGTPNPQDTNDKALDSFGTPTGPSSSHPFGVDKLGRDVFSRVIFGARISLEVAFISTALLLVVGVTLGLLAGYYRSWVDTLLSRVMDVLLAFPILLFAIGLASACSLGNGCLPAHPFGRDTIFFGLILGAILLVVAGIRMLRRSGTIRGIYGALVTGAIFVALGLILRYAFPSSKALIQPGLGVVIFVIAFVNWPYIARIIRGQVLSMREKEFVEAARSLGASNSRIVFREILPNLVAPIIVYATLVIPQNILFEAALSFLGVGVDPSQPSWGAMLSDATEIFQTAWWFMLFPGLALLITVLAFNLLGDGLQDALNPRTGK